MEARKCKDCGKVLYSSEGSEEWECKCGSIMTEVEAVPLEIKEVRYEQKCRVCGCTWNNACEGGCYWVEDDLCSKCALLF